MIDDAPLGELVRDGERIGMRFVRLFGHPPEKVWRAITESEHLRVWMPCDIVGERRAGAPIELPFWPAQVERYELDEPALYGEIRVWSRRDASSGRGVVTSSPSTWRRPAAGRR